MRIIDADELSITETWALVNGDNNSSSEISFAPLSCILKKDLDNAPTVERPQGEWSNESKDSLLCSACGKRVYKPFIGGFPTERTSRYYPNFCAFCGADMRKET